MTGLPDGHGLDGGEPVVLLVGRRHHAGGLGEAADEVGVGDPAGELDVGPVVVGHRGAAPWPVLHQVSTSVSAAGSVSVVARRWSRARAHATRPPVPTSDDLEVGEEVGGGHDQLGALGELVAPHAQHGAGGRAGRRGHGVGVAVADDEAGVEHARVGRGR